MSIQGVGFAPPPPPPPPAISPSENVASAKAADNTNQLDSAREAQGTEDAAKVSVSEEARALNTALPASNSSGEVNNASQAKALEASQLGGKSAPGNAEAIGSNGNAQIAGGTNAAPTAATISLKEMMG